MTNEQRVRELCRAIRGMAMNYPTGFDAIAFEVDTIRHLRLREEGSAVVEHSETPTSAPVVTQGERRKPGRPRKVQG